MPTISPRWLSCIIAGKMSAAEMDSSSINMISGFVKTVAAGRLFCEIGGAAEPLWLQAGIGSVNPRFAK